MKKKILATLVLCSAFASGVQAESLFDSKAEKADGFWGAMDKKMYLVAGVQGVGVGFGIAPASMDGRFGIRGEVSRYSTDGQETEGGINYNGELKLGQVGLFADYFPFAGSFRLTAGFSSLTTELNLLAKGAGTQQIGNSQAVFGPDDFIKASVDFGGGRPYLGFGFGHKAAHDPGLYMFSDVGVFFVDGKTTLEVSPNVRQQVPDSEIERERQELADAVGDVSVVPSLKIGIGYKF